MPTNSTNFNIPKPLTSEVFNLTNFNAILDAIDTNVKAKLDEKVASADYVKSPGYGVASGSANSYSVTLTPVPTSYADGMTVAVKINVDSTGASTLNVNGLGVKTLKKANGTDIVNLKANGVYTFRYNSTTGNFIVQGEGGSGDAVAGDLLSGKTASTDAGDIVGTLSLTGDATDADVLAGKTYYNTNAKTKRTGTMIAGKKFATGTATLDGSGILSITGLAFSPRTVYLGQTSNLANKNAFMSKDLSSTNLYANNNGALIVSGTGNTLGASNFTISPGAYLANIACTWWANE